jgi:hypothetical protein
MKIKTNTFSTLVLELFFPSIANCRKLKIQKNPKIDFPYCAGDVREVDLFILNRSFGYGYEAVRIRANDHTLQQNRCDKSFECHSN